MLAKRQRTPIIYEIDNCPSCGMLNPDDEFDLIHYYGLSNVRELTSNEEWYCRDCQFSYTNLFFASQMCWWDERLVISYADSMNASKAEFHGNRRKVKMSDNSFNVLMLQAQDALGFDIAEVYEETVEWLDCRMCTKHMTSECAPLMENISLILMHGGFKSLDICKDLHYNKAKEHQAPLGAMTRSLIYS